MIEHEPSNEPLCNICGVPMGEGNCIACDTARKNKAYQKNLESQRSKFTKSQPQENKPSKGRQEWLKLGEKLKKEHPEHKKSA